jgi:ribonuclease R
MEFNQNGKMIDYNVCLSVINSKKKMTYEELCDYFSSNEIEPSYLPFVTKIDEMRFLANLLRTIKENNGYLEFESSETHVKTDPFNNDQIVAFENMVATEADKIIEFFMIACNVTRAYDFTVKSVPILYRVHDKPNDFKLEDTFDLIKELGYGKQIVRLQNAYDPKAIQNILSYYRSSPMFSIISNLLLRSMAKAKDSVENIGHFALCEEHYCHSTAPIRRFPDLTLQYLEDIFCYDGMGYNHINEIREELCDVAEDYNFKERKAKDAERDYAKLKMAQFMDSKIGEEFVGIILDIDKEKVYVKLDNNVRGILDMHSDFGLAFSVDFQRKELICNYSKQKIKLGTQLLLKVSKVNSQQKEIYFTVSDILRNTKTNNNVKKRVKTKD